MERTRRFAVTMFGAITLSSVFGAPRRPSATVPMRLQGQTASAVTWHFDSLPAGQPPAGLQAARSEEHTSELQSQSNLVCRLLLEKKKKKKKNERRNRSKKRKWKMSRLSS